MSSIRRATTPIPRRSGEGQAHLLVVGDADRGIAWPYLLRSLEGPWAAPGSGLTDVSSVYGYPGPVAWGCTAGDPFIAIAWRRSRPRGGRRA